MPRVGQLVLAAATITEQRDGQARMGGYQNFKAHNFRPSVKRRGSARHKAQGNDGSRHCTADIPMPRPRGEPQTRLSYGHVRRQWAYLITTAEITKPSRQSERQAAGGLERKGGRQPALTAFCFDFDTCYEIWIDHRGYYVSCVWEKERESARGLEAWRKRKPELQTWCSKPVKCWL